MVLRFVKALKKRNRGIEEWGRLREILKGYEVKLAYLYGSYSRGEVTDLSDIDIAILFEPGAEKRVEPLRMDLTELLGEEAIDIVDLEKAPPRLKYNVTKDGKILLGEDHSAEFETKATLEYFDFKPTEEMYFTAMKDRIERDEFGRQRQDKG